MLLLCILSASSPSPFFFVTARSGSEREEREKNHFYILFSIRFIIILRSSINVLSLEFVFSYLFLRSRCRMHTWETADAQGKRGQFPARSSERLCNALWCGGRGLQDCTAIRYTYICSRRACKYLIYRGRVTNVFIYYIYIERGDMERGEVGTRVRSRCGISLWVMLHNVLSPRFHNILFFLSNTHLPCPKRKIYYYYYYEMRIIKTRRPAERKISAAVAACCCAQRSPMFFSLSPTPCDDW